MLSKAVLLLSLQVLTFFSGVDNSDQPYALYLPQHFDPARQYPLVLSLHGASSDHRLNLRQVLGRDVRDVDFIVAAPLARGTMGYRLLAETDVYDLLADLERRFPIDPDRVYLTGLSLGGGGALWLALTRPDVWAAVAAVCPEPPPGTEAFAPNALGLPIHLFHGELDDSVPVAVSRQWQKRLLNLGSEVEYVEYPGVHHNAWDLAYKNAALFDWFAKFKRNRFPERVRFTSDRYQYASAYWVRLDGLTPGTRASIDARFTGPNRIEAATAALDGFTLRLEGHPSFTAARSLEVIVDGAAHRLLHPRDAVSFRKAGAEWIAAAYQPAPGEKRPGLEGPIGAAFSAHHTYVYGAGAEEIARRAADWSLPGQPLQLHLPVVPDREAPAGNLVLFGNRDTNRLIARFAPRLPLELNPGAADYGLLFVVPIDNRYVVVNSGLPFWTGAADISRFAESYIGVIPAILDSFPDYVLFRGSLAHVVAQGRFGRDWKLPPGEAEKLKATGAVQIP